MCAMRNEGADDVERAHALLVMGRAADAVPCLLDAVAQDPGDPRASSLLAVAYLELGLNSEALEAAGRAAAVDPVQEFPHRLRATALLRLSRKPEALAAAQESVRLAPQLADAHVGLAEVLLADGQANGARVAAEAARTLAPADPVPLVMLSAVEIQAGAFREGEAHARAALTIDPENTAALHNLGIVRGGRGHHAEAVEYHAAASQLDPRNPQHRDRAFQMAGAGVAWAVVGILAALFILLGLASTIQRGGPREVPAVVGGVALLALIPAGGLWWRRRGPGSTGTLKGARIIRSLRREIFRGLLKAPRRASRWLGALVLVFGGPMGVAMLAAAFAPAAKGRPGAMLPLLLMGALLLLVTGWGAQSLFRRRR
jgi:tetratricopeptide (TPR) repeat protein